MELQPFVGPVLTALITLVGVYATMSRQLAVLETEIKNLREQVEKHNRVVERTFKMESDLGTAFKHIDQQRERIERLEDAKIGGTE